MAKPEWDIADIVVKMETLKKNIDDIEAAYRRLSRSHMGLLERFNDLQEELDAVAR